MENCEVPVQKDESWPSSHLSSAVDARRPLHEIFKDWGLPGGAENRLHHRSTFSNNPLKLPAMTGSNNRSVFIGLLADAKHMTIFVMECEAHSEFRPIHSPTRPFGPRQCVARSPLAPEAELKESAQKTGTKDCDEEPRITTPRVLDAASNQLGSIDKLNAASSSNSTQFYDISLHDGSRGSTNHHWAEEFEVDDWFFRPYFRTGWLHEFRNHNLFWSGDFQKLKPQEVLNFRNAVELLNRSMWVVGSLKFDSWCSSIIVHSTPGNNREDTSSGDREDIVEGSCDCTSALSWVCKKTGVRGVTWEFSGENPVHEDCSAFELWRKFGEKQTFL